MHDNRSHVSHERRNHQLTIRIPRRIRDAIGVQADAERRSVADVINNILAEHFPTTPKRGQRG